MKNNKNRVRLARRVSLAGCLSGLVLMCAGVASAAEVTVYAAASLTNAFRDMAKLYQEAEPDTDVVFSFAASDVLQRQIVNGAPADIFASADQVAMDKALDAQVILESTRVNFTGNSLVLIRPVDERDAAHGLQELSDLIKDHVTRIALGNPDTVPAGRYARDGLRASGLWPLPEGKQVLGQNVRQVLDYVARGEVDAGVVFATDAAMMPDRVHVVEAIPLPTQVLYPIALVNRDGSPKEAEDFYRFILSEKGQQILQEHGFGPP